MVGWPEYPDAFRTNRSLLQGQPKYRNWLTGAASTGFSLNDRGLQRAHDLIATLGPPNTTSGKQASFQAAGLMPKQLSAAWLPISKRDWLLGSFVIDPNRHCISSNNRCLLSLAITECLSIKNVYARVFIELSQISIGFVSWLCAVHA